MDRCNWLDNQGLAHDVLQAIQSIPTIFVVSDSLE